LTSRRWILVAGAVVLVAVLGLLWWLFGPRPSAPPEELAGVEAVETGEPVAFTLYFPGPRGLLEAEERELAVADAPRGRARSLVLALLEGPRTRGLYRPFPEEVGLLDVYLAADGVVYVDLGGEEVANPPTSGSLEEMARVYSLVETLTYNLPEVRRVGLLWNGVQRETLSGHLDTSRPLGPKDDLLSPAARRARAG